MGWWSLGPEDEESMEMPPHRPQPSVRRQAHIIRNNNNVYVRSDEYAWIPARLVSQDEDTAKVAIPQYKAEEFIMSDAGKGAVGFKSAVVKLKDYPNHQLPLQYTGKDGALMEVDDMVALPYLHEAAILYNLKSRHVRGLPYCRYHDIVLAVNPYQQLSHLYDEEVQEHYAKQIFWEKPEVGDPRTNLHPHIYEVAALCYRDFVLNKENQSILLTGESGAGKTESAKICMKHIAFMQQQGPSKNHDEESQVVRRILESYPLLEAFGNAKTRHNDNASRFGRYTKLQFTHLPPKVGELPRAELTGSISEAFLLEKSRVVNRDDLERNFHAFYHLLAAPDDDKEKIWKGLVGKSSESFRYLGAYSEAKADGSSNAERFQKVKDALFLFGIVEESYLTLYRAICACLQLGNLEFAADQSDANRTVIASKQEFASFCELVGCDKEVMEVALTVRTIKTRGEEYKVPVRSDVVSEVADGFAKEIYAKTFLWLVRSINDSTCADKKENVDGNSSNDSLICVLDIFGFQSFPINGFEQLCINYCNEKLQYKYTKDIFIAVAEEYKAEGFSMEDFSKYDDNSDVLGLIEGKLGLIKQLNEECIRPKGNDSAFVSKALKSNARVPCLIEKRSFGPLEFGIHHCVRPVVYKAQDFVSRNIDSLPSDIKRAAESCTNEILAKHLSHSSSANQSANRSSGDKGPRGRGRLSANTVMTQLRDQLNALMTGLEATKSRYIRCIKPNTDKKKLVMQHITTLEQLRTSGVVAAIALSRFAYPSKLTYDEVKDRYHMLKENKKEGGYLETRDEVEDICEQLLKRFESRRNDGSITKGYSMGKTMCYFKSGCLKLLEARRSLWTGSGMVINDTQYSETTEQEPLRKPELEPQADSNKATSATNVGSDVDASFPAHLVSNDSSAAKAVVPQYKVEELSDGGKTIVPLGWTKLVIGVWAILEVDIETFNKQWMEHSRKERFINWKDEQGRTMLHCAIENNRWDIVNLLLEHGADVNVVDKNGSTALMWASWKGHSDTAKLLVDTGADIDITNKEGWTALMYASIGGHMEVVELLLEKGADIHIANKDEWTAMMYASIGRHTEIMQLLVAIMDLSLAKWKELIENSWIDGMKNADIKTFNKQWMEHPKKERFINLKDAYHGRTMLHCAIENGRLDIAKLLFEHGADVNISDKNGTTALMIASRRGHSDTVQHLLEKGADLQSSDVNGKTALMYASDKGNDKIVEIFLDNGADLNIADKDGNTALMNASRLGDANMVKVLLDNGADIKIANRDGDTALRQSCSWADMIWTINPYEPNLEQPRRVAMKFMEKVEHFLNEIRTRRNDDGDPRFSSEFVTPDLASYRSDQDPDYAKACKTWKTNGSETHVLPDYCLVMPLAERSLLEAMNAENLSAKHKDLQRREILLTLCKIFMYLHEVGYIHGDVKPHNVVRHIVDGNVTWKAIDFDACTKIGDIVGLKLTTGSAPPEMLKIVKGEDAGDPESTGESKILFRQPGSDLDESDLVKADASFDVWSYGILMYQLLTGGSFFHCDLQGNVVDAGLQDWANLTQSLINKKLTSVEDVNARVLLSRILRLDPKERPTMSDIEKDYYFNPSESPQGRKADFIGKQVFSIFVQSDDALKFDGKPEDDAALEPASQTKGEEKDDDYGTEETEEFEKFISSKSEFSYFKLRDEDKDWSDKLLNSEVETFQFGNLGGMGEKPKFIDGDLIYSNNFLRGLLSTKGPDYFMGFLVEYFELYRIMNDAHEVCQGIKANLVSDVKSLKGIFIKLFVRGKGLNDIVRGTLFCNSIDQFKYVGRQLKEQYGHNVYIKPPKQEAGAWPIPKLLIYGQNRIDGRCMSVEIQFSTVYMHLAVHASNNHLVYEALRESTGYLDDKDDEFQEFLQSLNRQYIDTEGFLRNQSGQEGRFEILVKQADDHDNGGTQSQEPHNKYTTKVTGFILSGRIRCGDRLFRFMKSKDDLHKFSESSFVVNKSLTLLSSHSYWSEEPYDLEGKSVEFVVSFKGRGLAIAGIGTAKCLHGRMENDGGGDRCSVHVGRSKFVVRRSGVEEVFREKKLPNQERAKIIFKMNDGMLSVSFIVGPESEDEEELESVEVRMPSEQRYYLYMRAPPGVHDVKFRDINIK